jgi:hypothetical protein
MPECYQEVSQAYIMDSGECRVACIVKGNQRVDAFFIGREYETVEYIDYLGEPSVAINETKMVVGAEDGSYYMN